MFAKTIIDSDAFLEMPSSSQMLYFHLSMRADDDGFVNNPKRIMRMIGSGEDDLKLLFVKRFLIGFESGVVVIKHWKIHNYIQKDRYTKTMYQDEFARLDTKGNKAYTELTEPSNQAITSQCIQDVYKMDTQVRLGKDRLGKVISIEPPPDEGSLKNKEAHSKAEVSDFFESLWKLYPKKRGKNKVSIKSKKELYEIGFDEIKTAIDNYKDEIRILKTKDEFIQNGSTFFNGGWGDYSAENYEPLKSGGSSGQVTGYDFSDELI